MTTMPSSRTASARRHRRTLVGGLAASMVLHGVVLGSRTAVPTARAEPQEQANEPVRFQEPVLELVRLEVETPVKPVRQEVKAAAEPAEHDPSPEPAGSPKPVQVASSMRPDFSAIHAMTAFALQPVALPERAAEASDGEDEKEGRSFWARLGISTGRGGGACPIPRKPTPVVRQAK